MSMYGNIPRVGDRVSVLALENPDASQRNSIFTLMGPIPSRIRAGATLANLTLRECIVSAMYGSEHRAEGTTAISGVSLITSSGHDTGFSVLGGSYGYYSMLQVIGNLRNTPMFAAQSDDMLRTLFTLAWPQTVVSAEYARLIRDIRGEEGVPESARQTVLDAQALATQLNIRFVPLLNEHAIFAQPTLDEEEEGQLEELYNSFQERPRGRNWDEAAGTASEVSLVRPTVSSSANTISARYGEAGAWVTSAGTISDEYWAIPATSPTAADPEVPPPQEF